MLVTVIDVADNTNAERQRRYIARLKQKAAAAEAVTNRGDSAKLAKKLSETKDKLAQAQAKITELQHEIIGQAQAFRDESKRRAAKPKAERLPPTADEAAERQIKSLRTRVRNLTAEIQDLRMWQMSKMAEGTMSFDAKGKIGKALHPNYQPTQAEREDAFKAFSQFITGQRAANATRPKGSA